MIVPRPDALSEAASSVAGLAREHADALDVDDAFPSEDIAALAGAGLLHAPLPPAFGGCSLGLDLATAPLLADVLCRIGGGSLPLGRVFEGHVNAVKLAARFGRPEHLAALREEVDAGRISGVWNAQAGEGLTLHPVEGSWRLAGSKIYASGAGHIRRPLVTAQRAGEDGPDLVMPVLETGIRADLRNWHPLGMRASATGTVDFSGLRITDADIVGRPGDYYRTPGFAGGAWRFLAVQCGGMVALNVHLRDHLRRTGRGTDPHQLARFGQASTAVRTARLWVVSAALRAEDLAVEPQAAVAHVNFARGAVERAALDLMQLLQRSIGLSAFLRPQPVERITRDLATYLRQPFPDASLADAARYLLTDDTDPYARV